MNQVKIYITRDLFYLNYRMELHVTIIIDKNTHTHACTHTHTHTHWSGCINVRRLKNDHFLQTTMCVISLSNLVYLRLSRSNCHARLIRLYLVFVKENDVWIRNEIQKNTEVEIDNCSLKSEY